jgi:hypothetical protein
MRNEPPPEWLHTALVELATASAPVRYAKLMRKLGVSFVRYAAVREAHDTEGLSWKAAPESAAAYLRGQPAEASPGHLWAEYKKVRKLLRAAGTVRDNGDPGYSKSPG